MSNTSGTGVVTLEVLVPNDQFLDWRKAKAVDALPILVLNAIYLLFGVVGNSVVCYISAFRMKQGGINSFVLALAAVELLGCVFCIPVDMTEIVNLFWFDYPSLCKTERYSRKFVILASGCILVAIAVERYQRIVKPHHRYKTNRHFRWIIVGSMCLSALMAAPEALFAGSQSIQTPAGFGVICSTFGTKDFQKSAFPELWAYLAVAMYALFTIVLGTIYAVIAYKIWSRAKVHTNRRSRPNTPDSTLQRRVRARHKDSGPDFPIVIREKNPRIVLTPTSDTSNSPHSALDIYNGEETPTIQRTKKTDNRDTSKHRRTAFITELISTLKQKGLHQRNKEIKDGDDETDIEHEPPSFDLLSPPIQPLTPAGSVRRKCAYSRKRTTFIMFVMTLTTFLSHLPHVVVLLYRLSQPELQASLGPDASVLYYFAWNSYFISLSCHPFVYGFWNGRFKMALASMWDKFRRDRARPNRFSSSSNC